MRAHKRSRKFAPAIRHGRRNPNTPEDRVGRPEGMVGAVDSVHLGTNRQLRVAGEKPLKADADALNL